jgi:hypothetical protein
MAGLEVEIGADNAELEKKLADAEKLVEKFANQKEAKVKIGADTGDLDKKIAASNANLDKLKKGFSETAPAVSKFTKSTADGGNTLTQFSRIAQDAPFGIIGIGNNLTATAEAFGNLSKQTGGAGGALKAVASSLTGAGGILLAISLVTTGLTVLAQKGLTVGDVFNMITGDFDKAKQAMRELNTEAAKNAQAQISTVGAYVSVAKNINLSMEERLIAVKKLQDEYPAYFGNLEKEKILNGDISGTIRDVTNALKERARANAISGKVNELAAKQFEISDKTSQSLTDLANDLGLSAKEAKSLYKAILTSTGAVARWNQMRSEAGKSKLGPIDLFRTDGIRDDVAELKEVTAEIDRLTKKLNEAYSASIKLDYSADKTKKKTYDTPQVAPLDYSIETAGLVSLSGMITQVAKNVRGAEGVISTSFTGIRQNVSSELLATLKLIYDFNNALDALVRGSLTRTFEDLGTAIGTALAQGKNVFGAIGKSLIASLGAFLSDMGSLLIKYGTLAIAKGVIDKALTSGNPVVTVGAGVAAIAVGVALKAAGGAISAKASGSGSSSGAAGSSYSTGASYSSPSSSVSSGGSSTSNSGTVVFEISGASLIGVLGNAYDKNNRLGGSLSI